jgi:hypothetical protein
MRKAFRLSMVSVAIGTASYWGFLNKQDRENLYGAYLSIVSSSRAAWIVYTSAKDYQSSLNHLPYNSQEYHDARHEVHLRVANRIL